MSLTVRLGESLTVLVKEAEMPPPPDRAVTVLLFGLLAAGEGWTSRVEIARRLYPESDPASARNALRQTLFRLRRWLGVEITESRAGLLRTIPGAALCVWGEEAEHGALASWLDHPWIDAIREARRCRPSVPHFDNFSRAVESAAVFDVDAARSLLIGGSALALAMPPTEAMRLIGLTRPEDARAYLAFEHIALCAELQLHAMSYDLAKANFDKAYRLAVGRRSLAKAFRAACMSVFAHLESGGMAEATNWLERCAELGKGHPERPLLVNVRAAFLWNSGRVEDAVTLMRRSAPSPDAADGPQLLHYWSNFAMLASESGDSELAAQADEEARRFARPGVHEGFLRTLALARATGLMNQGSLAESLRSFEGLRKNSTGSSPDGRAYVEEAYAEALSRAGESDRAAEVWARAEATRRATNSRLTPRLAARKALILRAA